MKRIARAIEKKEKVIVNGDQIPMVFLGPQY